jgi:hypothetical protein
MQCKQAHEYAHIKCKQPSSWAWTPYLCASLVQEFWSFSILQCCSLFVHVQFILLPMMHLHIFVPTSPPLSSIFIKGVLLIDTKDCIGVDGWHLNLVFDGHYQLWWNDTTCSHWDTSCRIFDLDTSWWDTSSYVIAWVIHLISLSSLMWTGSRSSVRLKINNDLFGERHTDPASDHKDPNPATLAPRLLWLSTMSQSSWPRQEG